MLCDIIGTFDQHCITIAFTKLDIFLISTVSTIILFKF